MKSFLTITLLIFQCMVVFAEDYSFDIPEEPEKKLEWNGNLDGKYLAFHTRRSSPFYQLQFFNQDDMSGYLSQYRLELYLNADYQTKDIGFHLKTHSNYYNDSKASFDLFEAYGDINLSLNSFIQAGKKMYNWGKGYAFNPVGYVNPFKDPENPELSQAGLLSVNFEMIKSFNTNILKTFAMTAVIIPPSEIINNQYAEIENTDIAIKNYFMLWDIDIDIMRYFSKVNPCRFGADFSANLRQNIEIHGELSYSMDHPKNTIVNNNLFSTKEDGYTYLFGLRYLFQWNTTIIAEYYHNDIGLTETEYTNYMDFIQNNIDSNDEDEIDKALGYSQKYFKNRTLMQNYLYLKIQHPEPFNWLYFTPYLSTIYNMADRSFLLSISLSYKPITNFEFIVRPTFLTGNDGTEFGNKQNQQKLELWMRIFF